MFVKNPAPIVRILSPVLVMECTANGLLRFSLVGVGVGVAVVGAVVVVGDIVEVGILVVGDGVAVVGIAVLVGVIVVGAIVVVGAKVVGELVVGDRVVGATVALTLYTNGTAKTTGTDAGVIAKLE